MHRVVLLVTVLACLQAPACSTPAASPSPLTVVFADPVRARSITCSTCIEPPFMWAVAEFDVMLSDAAGRGGSIAFVDTVARDVSRGVELGRVRRPNADAALDVTTLPATGRVITQVGLRFDLPPPRDDVQVVVTVGLTDGRTGSGSARLVVQ